MGDDGSGNVVVDVGGLVVAGGAVEPRVELVVVTVEVGGALDDAGADVELVTACTAGSLEPHPPSTTASKDARTTDRRTRHKVVAGAGTTDSPCSSVTGNDDRRQDRGAPFA